METLETPRPPAAPARRPSWTRLEWLLPAILAAWLLRVSVGATSFVHGTGELVALGLLYGLVALVLHLGVRFALRAGAVLGALACLALAFVPAAQLRIDAQRLQNPLVFAVLVLALAAAYLAALRPFVPRDGRAEPRALAAACAALLALVGATCLAARASDGLRWHLFRHHRLLGSALYLLDARPLPVERDRLWSVHGPLTRAAEHVDPTAAPPLPAPRAPHVVFLLLDTLRADALAALGGAPDVMPAMNALAERSVVFTDVHANASWTRASCASIFTGLLPEEHGAARFHERLADEWLTLPELLRDAGYQTAAFVANWVQVGRETGFDQGFAPGDFHELMSGEEILERTGPLAGEAEVRGAYARAESVNRAVLEWLESDARDAGRPLFLYLHYLDPHAPYLEPPEPGTLGDPRERKRGLYRQQLRYLDGELADLLQQLEQALAGPTVVVFTSDHGEEFWEHGEWGHGHTLYRELLWVPLFVHSRDGRAGRTAAPLESRDLFALVQDLVRDPGLDPVAWATAHARGVRYASQYLDRVQDARPDRKWTGLRRVDAGELCLIWSAFGPTWELFDRARDPQERENRADLERASASALRAALERAVRFWTAPSHVERSPRELDFLRALGYAGGVGSPGSPGPDGP